MTWPEGKTDATGWYADFCERRDMAISGWLNSLPGITALTAMQKNANTNTMLKAFSMA